MQQLHGRSAIRESRGEENSRQQVSMHREESLRERRISGEPAKYNTRTTQRRIIWENDLYERQSN